MSNNIELRPYQRKFIDDVRKQFKKGITRVCGVAPCGAGKTIMTGWMIKEAIQRGKRAIFFVHRKELIDQTADTFFKLGIPFDIVSGTHTPNPALPCYISSVQTLKNKLEWLTPPDLLICDECHHILSKTYLDIINYWKKAFLLGVTATPQRLGGVRLGDVFNGMVLAPSVRELIKLGNLTPFYYLSPENDVNFDGLRTVMNDYVASDLEKILAVPKHIQGIVDKYIQYINGKSCICYCVNVKHSELTTAAFQNAGISAAHLDGGTPAKIRNRIIKDFRAGLIKVLCNAELLGEGFDVPNMDAVILARPTKSLTLHIQQSMRPMRPDKNNPDKIATIIDYVKNFEELGLPDANHDWSLKPNREKQEGTPPYKRCKKCGAICSVQEKFCPKCGTEFPPPVFDITKDVGNLASQQKLTVEFFLEIADKRGYKPYWAAAKALEYISSKEEIEHIADVMDFPNKKGWVYYRWKEFQDKKNNLYKT